MCAAARLDTTLGAAAVPAAGPWGRRPHCCSSATPWAAAPWLMRSCAVPCCMPFRVLTSGNSLPLDDAPPLPDRRAQLRVWPRVFVQGLGELIQVEVALHIDAHAPVWQGQLQGLAFLDIVQHFRKAARGSRRLCSSMLLLSTTRRLAGRLGGLAAAQRRPSAAAAPCG